MLFTLDFLNLISYFVQQLGIALGIGAETILLVAFIMMMRDGVVDDEEHRFARAVRRVLFTSLLFILLSGGAVVAAQYFATGSIAIITEPVFLFKWILIGLVLLLALFSRGVSLVSELVEGLAGGTWYALFLIHIFAPATTWDVLGILYGVWMAAFMVCWAILVFTMRGLGIATPTTPVDVRKPSTPQPIISNTANIMSKSTVSASMPISMSASAPVALPTMSQQAPASVVPPVPVAVPLMQQPSAQPVAAVPPQPIQTMPKMPPVAPMPAPMPKPVPPPVAVSTQAPAPMVAPVQQAPAPLKIDPITLVAVKPQPVADIVKQEPIIMPPAAVVQQAAPQQTVFVPRPTVETHSLPILPPIVAAPMDLMKKEEPVDLPAVRVMPQTPMQVPDQNRASIVRLEQE